MDNLNTIPNSGSFGDVSSKLNDNFSKVGQSLTTLENVMIANKGYFDTLASLQAAFPSPKAGNIAYVANVASSTGYYIYNVVSGVWTATTTEAPTISVDISSKLDTSVVKQTTGTSTTDVMSQDAATREFAKQTDLNRLSDEKVDKISGKSLVSVLQTTGADEFNPMSQKAVTDALNNIELIPRSGTYTDAVLLSLEKNNWFEFYLVDEVDGQQIKKLIYHIGNQVFIDAVGAVVELPIDEDVIHNFKFTIVLTEDNQTVYVPITTAGLNDIRVKWGDGNSSTYRGTTAKACSHIYNGQIGDRFQISVAGTIAALNFTNATYGNIGNLYSIDNNTLKTTMSLLSVFNNQNLVSICANAYSNVITTSLSFSNCSNLRTIGQGFGNYLQGKNITNVSFKDCENLASVQDDFFTYINLNSAQNLFSGCKLTKVPTSLKRALVNCSNMFYMFQGSGNACAIPDDLFDLVNVQITDVRMAFAGVSVVDKSKLTGNAKALYDVLSEKMSGTNTGNCFSNSDMLNRNQVPTSWGGTL